ncbi:unnamed protein product [Blepharisma stoltei]|uniref:Protein kinase domain-containing protein n=1 Tax=Blepharisma stoltei TaxID=1481888 RepID=A0AAU9I8P0_9CILI|nr:unnamed protein product [Blepharisma stoltei]
MRSLVFSISFLLGVAYTALFFYLLKKSYNFIQFNAQWMFAKIFYVVLMFFSLFRLISFWAICFFTSYILDRARLSYVLLSIPESLFLSSFLVLFWILASVYYYTHLMSYNPIEGQIRYPKRLKKLGAVGLIISALWVIGEIILYALFAGRLISVSSMEFQLMISNVAAFVLIVIFYCYLMFEYRNSYCKSSDAKKLSIQVLRVTLIWGLGRVLHILFYYTEALDFSSNDVHPPFDTMSENIPAAILLLDYLVNEIFCIYLVLRKQFFYIYSCDINSLPTTNSFLPNKTNEDFIDPSMIEDPNDFSWINSYDDPIIKEENIQIHIKVPSKKQLLGIIYRGVYNGHHVLIKRVKFTKISKYMIDQLIQEVVITKRLEGTHLLPLIGISTGSSHIDFVSPYMTNGSLFSAIHQRNSFFSYKDKLRIARELAFSLRNLHYQRQIHGHLTSHNVLFNKDWKVLVSDAGIEYFRKYAGLVLKYSNKSAWSSPEQLKDETEVVATFHPSDDSYSYGMILWELFTNQEPFPNMHWTKFKNMVKRGYRPSVPKSVGDGIKELILSCWNVEPKLRPGFSKIYMTVCMIEAQDPAVQ